MASPQKENGYIPIATEIVDKLCTYRISGVEWLIIWLIIRKTWGWSKTEDQISLRQFQEATEIKQRHHVIRAIRNLVAKRIIIQWGGTARGTSHTYKLNKNYDQWLQDNEVPKKVPQPKSRGTKNGEFEVPKKVLHEVPPVVPTIDNNKYISTAAPKKTEVPKKVPQPRGKRENTDHLPQSLNEYVELMRKSPQRHMQLLGEYADQIKPIFNTKGQWKVWTSRNVRAASQLAVFDDKQISQGMELIESKLYDPRTNPNGFMKEWTLETLIKEIGKLKK